MIYDKFIAIFGEYAPTVTVLADESEIVTINWGYVGSVAIFIILFYSLLRILGGIICAK